ncbi:hypothetical protein AGMMS50276_28800 [Synergistales bacterium]|nr:hypothetical protein AGMMS50276_28800 [Synergistales bacterium]
MAILDMDNINALMDKKVDKKGVDDSLVLVKKQDAPERKKAEDKMPCRDRRYYKRSNNIEDMRPNLRKAYDAGRMPPVHRALYVGIVNALNGETEGVITIDEVVRKSGISSLGRVSALNAFTIYKYMETDYVDGWRKLGTHVKLLKDPKDVLPEIFDK